MKIFGPKPVNSPKKQAEIEQSLHELRIHMIWVHMLIEAQDLTVNALPTTATNN